MRIVLAHNYYQIPGGEDETLRRERELLTSEGHYVKEFVRWNSEIKRTDILAKITLGGRQPKGDAGISESRKA
jgi:hypothetical protein